MANPVVITGGGTGGHIFPMQAIGEQLLGLGLQGAEVRYVGSRRGQEVDLLGSGPIKLTVLPGRGLRRSASLTAIGANLQALVSLVGAVLIALVRVGYWRPRVVVSVGGYASVPVSLAAVFWRRPLVLVELDAAPGASHRLVAHFAQRRCTVLPSSDPRCVVTGAPVRQAILEVDRSSQGRSRARSNQSPPIEVDRAVVVVMTGSLGARSVNRAVLELVDRWSSRTDRTIIHVTGRRDFDWITEHAPATTGLDYRIVAFGDMADLWALCDAAVCRAGATTLAELTVLGIPAVLVPLPRAPGDHQTKNAVALRDVGGAVVIDDEAISGAQLASALDDLLGERGSRVAQAARAVGHRDAARAIADVVLALGVVR